jgi:hypothetical protein
LTNGSSRPVLAACERKFFDIHITTGSHIAKQAVKRIGQLYAVEKIPAHQRLIGNDAALAQVKSIADALAACRTDCARLFRKSELAQTFRICGRAGRRQRHYLTITPLLGRRNVGTRTSSILDQPVA